MVLKINDRIRTRTIEFFNDVKVNLRFDSVASTFKLNYYFDPDNIEHKELSCVGHFHLCTLEHNNEVLLTGIVLSINFKSGPKKTLVSIGGYSLPGVLEDCEIPTSAYPLQTDSLSLRQIAERYTKPFGLGVVVSPSASADMDTVYEETDAKETQSVKSYLSELASQKNIIVSHTPNGNLLFTKASSNQTPIFNFEKGKTPATSMEFVFNGQAMHSTITMFAQSGRDDIDTSEEESVTNPYVRYTTRPKVSVHSSNYDDDTSKAVRNALANELRNIQMVIDINTWVLGGKIVRPGKIVTVLNPEVYMYKKAKWFIEEVNLSRTASVEEATLKCVLPECYTGETPKYLFEGVNLH